MQITKIKSKFTHRNTELIPDRIFSLTNEEVLVTIGGRVVSINRDKNKEHILIGAQQPENYYHFYDKKLYINPLPLHLHYNQNRMYSILDLNSGKLNNIYHEPISAYGEQLPYFTIGPDFNDPLKFYVFFQNTYGYWHHQSCYHNAVEQWANGNFKIWQDETRFISQRHMFIDCVNKQYYCLFNPDHGAIYHIQNILTREMNWHPIYRHMPNCFAVFNGKEVFGTQMGVYSDYKMLDGRPGVVNYSKQVNRLKISPDNQFLVFASFKRLIFIDTELKEYRTLEMAEDIIDFDYSPDQLTLNVLTKENVITLDMD